MDHPVKIEEKFVMSQKLKNLSFGLIAIGLIGVAVSYMTYHGEEGHKHFWASMVLMAVFFQGIIMASCFFQAATYVAYGGWHTVLKRIPEGIAMMLPFTIIILLIVLAVPNLIYGHHPVYHWTDHEAVTHDPILSGKSSYLNLPFFFLRFAFFLGLLLAFTLLMRRNSLKEDLDNNIKYYKSNLKWASLFLLFFAIYISVSAWDWLMSIDAHWYSTMYGWYSFASFWVTGIAVITLVVLYLKSKNYLSVVTDSHLHDLGKLMFAFSVFWTYLTFCQFMLIWYANIPEETTYFRMRYDHFMWGFYGIFLINFVTPFLILMSRDAKRKKRVLAIVACIIIIGHFLDFYMMIYPATMGRPTFGLVEISAFLFYVGLFIYIVFTNLSKANLVPKNHPFLEESLHHSI